MEKGMLELPGPGYLYGYVWYKDVERGQTLLGRKTMSFGRWLTAQGGGIQALWGFRCPECRMLLLEY
jgi:hypothetical protein